MVRLRSYNTRNLFELFENTKHISAADLQVNHIITDRFQMPDPKNPLRMKTVISQYRVVEITTSGIIRGQYLFARGQNKRKLQLREFTVETLNKSNIVIFAKKS